MLAEYVYLGDQLLAMIKPGDVAYYYHNDHLGTPQVLTDDAQTIAWKAVFTPFGEAVASIEIVGNPFRFPGQYYDAETGLHYNYFRYYNPQTGRYITPDPIGLEGGINLFVYVGENPVNWIDPEGLDVLFVGVGGGAFISESLFGKKGWLSQVYFGLAFDTTTQKFIVYKSSAATKPSVDTVMGLGFGPGATGGWVKDNMNDFLGKSREQTYYAVFSYTKTVTCSGRPGRSFGIGKGIAVGYTDVTTDTRVLLDFNELSDKYDKWLDRTSAKINNWLNKVLTPRWY
jgi:RHS repeat-associated protein